MNPTIIGIIGLTGILTAFILEEFTLKYGRKSVFNLLLNIFGSLCLSLYAYFLSSGPFLILNGAWFLIAVSRLTTLLYCKKTYKEKQISYKRGKKYGTRTK